MITVSDDDETLEIGSTRDELIKYLKECTAEDYARDVLRWYDTDRARPLTLQNGDYSYDIWKIT